MNFHKKVRKSGEVLKSPVRVSDKSLLGNKLGDEHEKHFEFYDSWENGKKLKIGKFKLKTTF